MDISLSEISTKSGVNHGLVKYHFENKEGLLFAVLQRDAGEAIDQFRALMRSNISPDEKLKRHLKGVIDTYREKPYINRLISHLQCSGAKNARRLSEAFVGPLQQLQADLLEQAADAGVIKPTDPLLFYFTTIGACDFLFQSRNILNVTMNMKDISNELSNLYADYLASLILKGLSPG